MQRTAEDIQYNQNGSANAGVEVEEDSTSMTVEYLRARLLSERSVTKATRERANELAKRVVELEEQLKIVCIQRKKAEKATLDVLALLENHGMAEISDEYDSDSDSDSGMEESLYEPNMEKGNSDTSKQKEDSSGSEHESTPSTGRSLSWKSSRGSPRSCERKCFDPRKQSNFVHSASSSRHRLGKSCRQIKRREVRSIVEESKHDSRSPDVGGSAIVDHSNHITSGLHSRPEELRKSSQKNDEKTFHNEQIIVSSEAGQVSDGSVYLQKHTSDGEMERALQHQARLIGRYAAEEKAQREWEEKYMGNGCSIPDICEPGNQSDVTEDRDAPEERAPSPIKNVASNSNSHKSKEPIDFAKGSSITHVDSFKFPSNPSIDSSRKIKEAHSSRTSASDFAFPVANETHVTSSPPPSFLSKPQYNSPYSHTNGDNNYRQAETTSNPKSIEYAIVPHENPQRLSGVLDALQQAKQLLGRNISSLPLKDAKFAGSEAEALVSSSRDTEIAKMAVGSAGLFRVPTDFQFQASIPHTTVPSSGYPSLHSSLPLIGSNQNRLHSTETKPFPSTLDPFFSNMNTSSEPRSSSNKLWYGGLPPTNGFTPYSSNPTYPDMTRRISSGEQLPYIVQSPSRTPDLPPTGHPYLYNDHIRPVTALECIEIFMDQFPSFLQSFSLLLSEL
ncbi:hypothetical protein V2J09_013572 [Rumex salicifolius]